MIPLRIVTPFPEESEPGMMWRYESGDADGIESWWIVLPGDNRIGTPGHPDAVSWRTTDRASSPPYERWTVTGVAPLLTVTPSIDVHAYEVRDGETIRAGSYWHGFITNGQIVG